MAAELRGHVAPSLSQQIEDARALYQDADLGRLVDWVLRAVTAVSGGHVAAFCLMPLEGRPAWWVSDWHVADFEAVGSPWNVAAFGPALRGEAIADVRETVLDRDLRRFDVRSIVAVPVQRAEGGVLGLLVVGHREPDRFDDEHKAGVLALAAHLGVALDTRVTLQHLAELEATQRQIVYQLQEAVRPAIPEVPDTELGVSYVAADPRAPTGGDLYDWTVLPDGDLHIAVVDVEGKGVAATKDALAIVHTLRILALEGVPLEDLVARTDRLVRAQNPDLVATLVAARYSPATGVVRIAGGGHPPPLVVSKDRARQLDVSGLPIGYPGAGSEGVIELQLDRRDVLILYTDGVVEARRDILAGLATLTRAALETRAFPAPYLARALLDRALAGADRDDDSLVLVLRRRTPPSPSGRAPLAPFEHRFSPTAATVPIARHFLRDWLERLPADPEAIEDVLVVASELCTNAIHAASGEPTSVALGAWADGADLVVEVSDDGSGFTWPDWDPQSDPDPNAEAGRGLYIVRALVDDVTIRRETRRTVVRCVIRAIVHG